jgi:UDP-2,3-diacylglucosamine pyrophosphatase LpxH
MLGRDILKTLSILFLIITGCAFFNVTIAPAQSAGKLNIDLNKSDSAKLQATIMEIDAAKGILIVAEKEIYIVDLLIEGHQFKTALRNVEDKSVPFESFHVGQRVYVAGIEFERDRVAASLIQHSAPRPTRQNH